MAGSRVVLRAGTARIAVRTLRDVDLDRDWEVPVLALTPVAVGEAGEAELSVPAGDLRVAAHLTVSDGTLLLRSGAPPASTPPAAHPGPQRRADVRGPVELPLRGVVVAGRGRASLEQAVMQGRTLTVSAGGICAEILPVPQLPVGTPLFLELSLSDGKVVPAVVAVVEHRSPRLRARFVDLAPADRERLVRMVFLEERKSMQRRRLR